MQYRFWLAAFPKPRKEVGIYPQITALHCKQAGILRNKGSVCT